MATWSSECNDLGCLSPNGWDDPSPIHKWECPLNRLSPINLDASRPPRFAATWVGRWEPLPELAPTLGHWESSDRSKWDRVPGEDAEPTALDRVRGRWQLDPDSSPFRALYLVPIY